MKKYQIKFKEKTSFENMIGLMEKCKCKEEMMKFCECVEKIGFRDKPEYERLIGIMNEMVDNQNCNIK